MTKVIIHEDVCKSCGLCVRLCPKEVLALQTKHLNAKGYYPVEVAHQENCIGCLSCAMTCPDVAIEIEK